MVTRRIGLTFAALAGIGLAVCQGASAQVIVQSFTIPALTPASTWNPFTFNTSLGTLDEVLLSVTTTINANVIVFNQTANPLGFTDGTATIPENVTAPGVPTITDNVVAGPLSGIANPLALTTFSAPPATNTDNVSVPVGQFSFYENPPTGLTLTIGASAGSGSFSGTETGGSGDLFFGGNATGSGSITLTYLYQPAGTIPEPGATTFLAAGVLGSLGMVIRRRRKK